MSLRCTTAFKFKAAILTIVLLAGGCAAKRETVFIAATDATVSARLEVTGDGMAQRVVVTNLSTVPITVTSVRLHSCENIKNRCDVVRLRVQVEPNQKRNVLVVRPEAQNKAYKFEYSWSWEAANRPPEISR